VTIEGSDHFYGATLQIIPEEHDDETSPSLGRGLGNLMSRVFGKLHALPADRISSPKHMTKFMYRNLNPGKYIVKLHQPEKPSDCDNIVDVLFQVSQILEARLQERFSEGKSVQVRY